MNVSLNKITGKALMVGINTPLSIRLTEYKRFRKPKYARPFSKSVSFVCAYGKCLEVYRDSLY